MIYLGVYLIGFGVTQILIRTLFFPCLYKTLVEIHKNPALRVDGVSADETASVIMRGLLPNTLSFFWPIGLFCAGGVYLLKPEWRKL